MSTSIFVIALLLHLLGLGVPDDPHQPDMQIEDDRIGLIQSIDVDEQGRVYVGDYINMKIHRYTPDGTYDDSFGGRGQGPGEFQAISGMDMGPNDSLFVHDRMARRIVAFSIGNKSRSTTTSLPSRDDGLSSSMIGGPLVGLHGIWVLPDGEKVVVSGRGFSPENRNEEDRSIQIHFLGAEDAIVTVPDREFIVFENGGFSVRLMPFGQRPVVAVDQDGHILYGTNEQIEVEKIDPHRGNTTTVVEDRHTPVPVTDELLEAEIERTGSELTSDQREQLRRQVPDVLPAFEHMVVDDENRIWVAVNEPDAFEEGNTTYRVFDEDGERRATLTLEGIVFLQVVQDGRAYGIRTGSSGVQKVDMYNVDNLL